MGVDMKRMCFFIVIFLLVSLTAQRAKASTFDMIFWYPGEAGSSAEAGPLLDELFSYINKSLKGNKIAGNYINNTASGLVYIKNKKPNFGIVSWTALEDNRSTLTQYSIMMQTLPLPEGKATDQYTLIGISDSEDANWSPPDRIIVNTSIPLSLALLKSKLAPILKDNVTVKTTKTMLMTLKKIASGETKNEVALLTPMEKYTLDNLKGEWTTKLKTLYRSAPVPTAQLVYFGEKPQIADQLSTILKDMNQNPEGKEILETLRLEGFK